MKKKNENKAGERRGGVEYARKPTFNARLKDGRAIKLSNCDFDYEAHDAHSRETYITYYKVTQDT
jgi:hypothetical protein